MAGKGQHLTVIMLMI